MLFRKLSCFGKLEFFSGTSIDSLFVMIMVLLLCQLTAADLNCLMVFLSSSLSLSCNLSYCIICLNMKRKYATCSYKNQKELILRCRRAGGAFTASNSTAQKQFVIVDQQNTKCILRRSGISTITFSVPILKMEP